MITYNKVSSVLTLLPIHIILTLVEIKFHENITYNY